MINKLAKTLRLNSLFLTPIAIDATSDKFSLYKSGEGVVINTPAIIAVDDKKVISVGDEAVNLAGKNPEGIILKHPTQKGVVADVETFECLLTSLIRKTMGKKALFKLPPTALVVVPHHATVAEKTNYDDALSLSGIKTTLQVSSLICGAYGIDTLKPETASAALVCNINTSYTEIGIISVNKVHASTQLPMGYDDFIKAIISYVRTSTEYSIGTQSAQRLFESIGAAYYDERSDKNKRMTVSGMKKRTSVPADVTLESKEVSECFEPLIRQLLEGLLVVLEKAQEGMAEDIMQNGITIFGKGAMLPRIDTAIQHNLEGLTTNLANNPTTCVIRGAGILLEKFKNGSN